MATNGGPGNGEKLSLQIGSKSLAIASKDLVSVLLVIGAFAGMWLAVQHVTTNQERGFAGLQQVLEKQNAHQAILVEVVHTNRTAMMDVLEKQNTMVQDQTVALRLAVEEQTKILHDMLETINWNIGREPSERLPLLRRPPERPERPDRFPRE